MSYLFVTSCAKEEYHAYRNNALNFNYYQLTYNTWFALWTKKETFRIEMCTMFLNQMSERPLWRQVVRRLGKMLVTEQKYILRHIIKVKKVFLSSFV